MDGELYFDGLNRGTERGPFVIICSTGTDGNVADVYGETDEEAEEAARTIISCVNNFSLLFEACREAGFLIERLQVTQTLSEHNGMTLEQARQVVADNPGPVLEKLKEAIAAGYGE
jgi:hypothetical protein